LSSVTSLSKRTTDLTFNPFAALGSIGNESGYVAVRLFDVMKAKTTSTRRPLSRDTTRAGRSLVAERSVKGNEIKTMLPKSAIAFFDVGDSVKVGLVGQPVEGSALFRHLRDRHVVGADGLENHAHPLARLNAASRHFGLHLSGFDIFQYLSHGRILSLNDGLLNSRPVKISQKVMPPHSGAAAPLMRHPPMRRKAVLESGPSRRYAGRP
jgi:hypothetical protein